MEEQPDKKPQKEENDNEDYYFKNGLMVFTKVFHLKRGYCCKNGCLNCPWGYKKVGTG